VLYFSESDVRSINYRIVRSAPAHTEYFQPVFGTYSYSKFENTEMITQFDLEDAEEATSGLKDAQGKSGVILFVLAGFYFCCCRFEVLHRAYENCGLDQLDLRRDHENR